MRKNSLSECSDTRLRAHMCTHMFLDTARFISMFNIQKAARACLNYMF